MRENEELINEYLNKPYALEIIRDPGGYYVGSVKEFDGCMTQGETEQETLDSLKEVMRLWIATAFNHGVKIPEPTIDKEYSGKFLLRIPKSLHRRLAITAEDEAVSLNQYIVYILSTFNQAERTAPRFESQISKDRELGEDVWMDKKAYSSPVTKKEEVN